MTIYQAATTMSSIRPSDTLTRDLNGSTTSDYLFLPSRFIPYLIYLVLLALVGTLGNILIMSSVALNRKLQVNSNVFVVNLAIADLQITAISIPMTAAGLFNDAQILRSRPFVCDVLGAMLLGSSVCSVWSIVAISLERFFHICYPTFYPKIYNRRYLPVMVFCIWLLAATVIFLHSDIFRFGSYGYKPRYATCFKTFNAQTNYFKGLRVIAVLPMSGLFLAVYCNVRIYLAYRFSKRRVLNIQQRYSNVPTRSFKNWTRTDIKILKTIGTILIVLVVMWAPTIIDMVFNLNDAWPYWYTRTAIALALTNSSINFIIYGAMNANFGDTYCMIYHRVFWCCHHRVRPTKMDTRLQLHVKTFAPVFKH